MPLCTTLCFNYPNKEDEQRQYNSVRVPSSQYTNVLASFTGNQSDLQGNDDVSVKHDSYARYLNKRKAGAMLQNGIYPAVVTTNNVTNNKRYKNGVSVLSEKCQCT